MADEEYARSVAKIVASQMLTAHGVDSTQRSSLEILADLLLRFIVEIGKQSHTYAELSHRAECTPIDMEVALTNLGMSVPVLKDYLATLDEIPFAGNISKFPLPKRLSTQPTFAEQHENPPGHIPSYLPAFPDDHAHMETPQFPQADTSAQNRQEKLTEQQQKAQEALLKVRAREVPESQVLQQAARIQTLEKENDDEKAAPNPFLSNPVWEGKDGLDAFGPIESAACVEPGVSPAMKEWKSLPDVEARGGFSTKFKSFKMGDFLSVQDVLATSGRPPEDAYGADLMEDAAAAGDGDGRRRRTLIVGDEAQVHARVRHILAAGGDEGEGIALAAEALPEEEI